MKKNIYLHELRIRWRSVATWLGGLLFLHLLYLPFFSAFAEEAEMLNQVMANFPPEFLQAFGMNGVDLSTVLGFYSLVFTFVQVCLAIQAANYGFGLLSVEEAELTADFLMTKPVSRAGIWISKVLAALTSLLVTEAGVWAIAFLTIPAFNGGRGWDAALLAKLLFSLLPFQLAFFSIGLAVSMLVRRIRSVTPYGLGLGFGMYVLNAFGGMLGDTKLEWITPFKHFDPPGIINSGEYSNLIWISVAATLIGLLIAWVRYLRRDIPSVT